MSAYLGTIILVAGIVVFQRLPKDEFTNSLILKVFVTVFLAQYPLFFYLYQKIKGDASLASQTVTVPPPQGLTADPNAQPTVTNAQDYDLGQVWDLVKKSLLNAVIMGGIFYKFGSTQPLFMQSLMIPVNLFNNPLIKVHLLGEKAENALARPWAASSPSPFGLGGSTPATGEQADSASGQLTTSEAEAEATSSDVSRSTTTARARQAEPEDEARITELPDEDDSENPAKED
ncbi:hypothetical protein H696_05608 [Fonticula alba]|uniref:Uncharacterized protein n=1 Tax=Fonticula alba TaxID=691883 RepID=A0A058Z0U2_FONAL|nr:hypothetical protein H696_05608 [Fonticula alba]KCV67879.1 hypothetical protein H696_05608 [Fonticula alba]|eukprot:XP_009497699.1 hypothetical protein H696_05608 [Fonticula alba]